MTDVLSFHEPEGLSPRGTLLVVPGRGEAPSVYRRFGARLAVDAYRVHVVSDPTADRARAHDQLVLAVDSGTLPRPLVLIGSDTGALFAAALLAEEELSGVDGLILAGLPVAGDTEAAASWDEELDHRSSCPTHRGRISDSIVRPGALYESVPEGWLERSSLDALRLPILALHGRDDPISAVDAAYALYATAPATEFVEIDGALHDVLNDQSHRTVAATVILWLERLRAGDGLAAIANPRPLGVRVA